MATPDKGIQKVRQTLKEHFEEDFEIIENYWQKFSVRGILKMDTFYNQNIVINDKNRKFRATFESVDQLFCTNSKRFIIISDAGYGKSTFVHEMARQWVKGENLWTKKFSLLFVFRLTEISQNETQSLRMLLTKCLNIDDAAEISEWLKNAEHMKNTLFIFDGLDELQYQFCKEVDDIIYGKGINHPHVVVTSRPGQKIEEIEKPLCNNLYIELKGYTDKGVDEQLKTFKINPITVRPSFRTVLKVPLFNTLFCITHKETPFGCLNICTAIEKFVKFAFNRYRKTMQSYTATDENELLLILGQASQNKFSLIRNTSVDYPIVKQHHLIAAKETGLVFEKSTLTDFVFAHQTIAEYCAAYFWFKKHLLKIKEVTKSGIVTFENPLGGRLKHSEPFSSFISHLNLEYKLFLWQYFENVVPLLDEYESLPTRMLKENELNLAKISVVDHVNVMNTIEFMTNKPLYLFNAYFETGKKFTSLSRLKSLELSFCSFKISPQEFFHSYNFIHSLILYGCNFCNFNSFDDGFNESRKTFLGLQVLIIWGCNITVVNLVSYIFRHSMLKRLTLIGGFLDGDSGNGWMHELVNNQRLLNSIEHFELNCSDPVDLTMVFGTLEKLINLKTLQLEVDRKLSNSEVDALKHSLQAELQYLEAVNLALVDEDGKRVDFKKI